VQFPQQYVRSLSVIIDGSFLRDSILGVVMIKIKLLQQIEADTRSIVGAVFCGWYTEAVKINQGKTER
jgi:hypothetical protein